MRLPRVRFTVRRMMIAVALAAVAIWTVAPMVAGTTGRATRKSGSLRYHGYTRLG